MGFPLSAQAQGFLSSLLLGFSLALIYDLLRALRLSRRDLAFLTPLCDTLYCALFALLVFLFSMRVGGGELRLYMLFSVLLGAVSSASSASKTPAQSAHSGRKKRAQTRK